MMKTVSDSFQRRINYIRVSVTDRCNYRCTYCSPGKASVVKPRRGILRYEEIAAVAGACGALGFTKLRLTGGEPLVRKDIEVCLERIAALKCYPDISLTTNGSLLTFEKARSLRAAGLMRINISLDTVDPLEFGRITGGGKIGHVLRGIDAALDAGLSPVKINMVVFPDTAEDAINQMRDFCAKKGAALQLISRFSLEKRFEPQPDAPRYDRPHDCAGCNRIRLTTDGFFKPCLFSDHEIKVDFSRLEESVLEAIRAKPRIGEACLNRSMSEIGG